MTDGVVVPDLVLVEQFLNTLDERTFTWHGEKRVGGDTLTSVESLADWFGAHGLGSADRDLRSSDLAAAVALRVALRGALSGGSDGAGIDGAEGTADTAGAAEIAEALARFPLRLAPDPAGRLRVGADSGVPGLDAIVETVAASVAGGGWSRLKLCSSVDCRWAFYDTSRNGGGRWCSMEACGNRNKTRAYRQRRATDGD